MNTFISIFNTREQALIIWLLIFIAILLSIKKLRVGLKPVIKAIFAPKLVLVFLCSWIYIWIIAGVASIFGLWNETMIKDTTIWMFASVLLLSTNFEGKKAEEAIIQILKDSVHPIIVYEFIVNLNTFSLIWELILLPVVTFVYLIVLYSKGKNEYRSVYIVFNFILSIWGAYIAYRSIYYFVQGFGTLNGHQESLNLILPIWLTVGFIPYLLLVRVYSEYESNRIRKRFKKDG